MDLNDRQRDTLDRLIGPADARPGFDPAYADELKARIDAVIGERTTLGGVWIGKSRLAALARCEGMFAADVLDEGEPFRHTDRSAIGAILHRAIQIDVEVVNRERDDRPDVTCRSAVEKLLADGQKKDFRAFWEPETESARDAMLAEAAALLVAFRANFPPLRDMRQDLIPAAEQKFKVEAAGGNVSFSGVVDLMVGMPTKAVASRLLIDHKTGGARPEFVEDMRFYALLHTLRRGEPPYRVASYFVETGEWQAEDVTARMLEHAADRAAVAARLAIAISEGDAPSSLTPGPYCSWCPRAKTCPSSAA